jgi:hypothetical protein
MNRHQRKRDVSTQIVDYLESRVCSEPSKPFILAGEMIKDLNLSKSEFYIGIGLVLGYRIEEHIEGKKRYYYLSEMVKDFREKKKKDIR